MAKNTNTTESILSTSARSAVVASFVNAYATVENGGSLVTQLCETLSRHAKGETIPKADSDAIIASVSRERGWKGKTANSRESEVRIVIKSYANLGDAVVAIQKRMKSCNWHRVMKAARKLAKGESVPKAVAFACTEGATGKGKANPSKAAAGALKRWFEHSRGDKRANIIKACQLLGLDISGVTK